jgi:hypothetical protein
MRKDDPEVQMIAVEREGLVGLLKHALTWIEDTSAQRPPAEREAAHLRGQLEELGRATATTGYEWIHGQGIDDGEPAEQER